VMRYSSGVLPAKVHKTPEQLEAETLDYFCWDYQPGRGDTVIDVGAGVGTEVVTFSRQVGPSGKVYALEAHPDEFRRLQRVIAANQLSNVVPLQLALSDHVGTVSISTVAENIDSHSIVNATTFRAQDHVVPATTLDELVTDEGIARIDLLKMNIEGAELLVIRAADKAMDITDHVSISCHDFVADDGRGGDEMRTRADVLAYLERHGFDIRSRDGDSRRFVRDYLYGSKGR